MHNDFAEVDELLLELADYKNDYAEAAAEKLLWKCSTSWEAYRYLQDCVHEAWLPVMINLVSIIFCLFVLFT